MAILRETQFALWLRVSLFCAASLLALPIFAQNGPSKEDVKAGFLFNFAKFVEWPTNTLATNGTIRIGLLGKNDAFAATLQHIIHGKQIESHQVVFEVYDELPANPPHILYISPPKAYGRTLAALANEPILTVSDTEGFCQAGGIINFRMDGRKVRFEINPKAAESRKLKLSSKLLGVAVHLVETGGGP